MLTIMTPTYNRAKTLDACYESLLKQTNKNFTWMVIDDGSIDSTEELVQKWIEEKNIEIIYLKKENGGKGSALNYGIQNLTTPYACCLDSDDTFYYDAVRLALKQLEEIENDNLCCGILAARHNPDGSVMGDAIPKTLDYSTVAHVYQKRKGETICFYKTSILRNYQYPIFSGERFVAPSWIDYEICRKYYFKISWDKFCFCEYIDDGITRNKKSLIIRNPHGYTCGIKQAFEFAPTIRTVISRGIMYNCGCILCKDKNWLKNAPRKGWALVLRPLGWIAYYKRFWKLSREHNKKHH